MQFKLLQSFYLNGKQEFLVLFSSFALNMKKGKEKSLKIRSTNRTHP